MPSYAYSGTQKVSWSICHSIGAAFVSAAIVISMFHGDLAPNAKIRKEIKEAKTEIKSLQKNKQKPPPKKSSESSQAQKK